MGDSLSPLLFVIAVDTLEDIFKMPFRVSINADDVIAFINPSNSEMHAAVRVLEAF
mgnify:CR=1 FL=1